MQNPPKPWAKIDQVVFPQKAKGRDPRVDGAPASPPSGKLTLKDMPKAPAELDWDIPADMRVTHIRKNTPTAVGLGAIESRFVPPPPVVPRPTLKAPVKPIAKPPPLPQAEAQHHSVAPSAKSITPVASSAPTAEIRIGDTSIKFGKQSWTHKLLRYLIPVIITIVTSASGFFVTRYETIKADWQWRAMMEASTKAMGTQLEVHKVDLDGLYTVTRDLERNQLPKIKNRISDLEGSKTTDKVIVNPRQ